MNCQTLQYNKPVTNGSTTLPPPKKKKIHEHWANNNKSDSMVQTNVDQTFIILVFWF